MVEGIGGLDVVYMDLWRTAEEEQDSFIFTSVVDRIAAYHHEGTKIIALGLHVFDALAGCMMLKDVPIVYLPHPASRRPQDLQKLEDGLLQLKRDAVASDLTEALRGNMKSPPCDGWVPDADGPGGTCKYTCGHWPNEAGHRNNPEHDTFIHQYGRKIHEMWERKDVDGLMEMLG